MSNLPDSVARVRTEIETYYRVLPGLVIAGHTGRAVLIKGDQMVGVWPDHDRAYEAGIRRFCGQNFLAQPIDPKDIERFAPYFPVVPEGVLPWTATVEDTAMPNQPDVLAPLRAELETYFRELPRLLADGQAGRVAVVKGDELSVWDTDDDALQYAGEKYGFGPFLAQPIDPRDIARLAPFVQPAAVAPAARRSEMSNLPDSVAPLRTEIETYYRVLPGLIADGHAGKGVLIKGDQMIGVWDDEDAAFEAGVQRYWPQNFLAQPIDPKDIDRWAPYFPVPSGSVPA